MWGIFYFGKFKLKYWFKKNYNNINAKKTAYFLKSKENIYYLVFFQNINKQKIRSIKILFNYIKNLFVYSHVFVEPILNSIAAVGTCI